MKNLNRFMEMFWLVAAILALILAIYYINETSWEDAWYYLLFPLTALMMYGYRRGMRSRLDRWSNEDEKRS